MLNIFLLKQFVINRQHSATGIAENMLHAIIAQRLQDDLSTVYLFFHRSIRALSRVSKELRAQTPPRAREISNFHTAVKLYFEINEKILEKLFS